MTTTVQIQITVEDLRLMIQGEVTKALIATNDLIAHRLIRAEAAEEQAKKTRTAANEMLESRALLRPTDSIDKLPLERNRRLSLRHRQIDTIDQLCKTSRKTFKKLFTKDLETALEKFGLTMAP